MLVHLLNTTALLLALLSGWVAVQAVARRFARRHPEFGAYKDAGGSCGGGCGSCGQPCAGDQQKPDPADPHRLPEAPDHP